MYTLSQHIERLLLTHNCVVVPHFGAFVTMTSAATRVEHENLFFPPLRIVRFNPNVVEDDGLLVSDVKRQRRCSDAEAKHAVQAMVLQLRQQLLAESQVDFGSIGCFTQDEDGRVAFASCQAGAVTPCYFGLDAFAMPRLTPATRRGKSGQSVADAATGHSHDNHHITIRVSRRGLRYAVLSLAAVLVCLTFTSPLPPVAETALQEASILLPTRELPAVVESVTPSQKAATVEVATVEATPVEVAPATPAAEEVQEVKEEAATVAATEGYCIVLASAISQRNGEAYVARLQQMGYGSARVHNNGKMRRVVIDGFATEAEANALNAKLHQRGKDFATTWVMKL